MEPCVQVGITALRHQLTLTSLPAACRGLTPAQLNLAADTATATVVGALRGKRLARARKRELRPLLPPLGPIVRAQRSQPVTAPAASPASGPPAGLVALAAWLITVGLGLTMMARWIARGGFHHPRAGRARSWPVMNLAHLGLAVAGLVTWVIYLMTGLAGLAWTACVLLMPVAGLGMSLLLLRQPERATATAAVSPARAGSLPAGTAAIPAGPGPEPARHPPALVIAAHVAFAVATILFTLLAAVGSR
jgi:hypothetical protein